MQYRPEIDGLRTIAVLPVVLFHADFALFAGGFVGVDVFFVISGYLITTILIADISAGRYSLLQFYERRARRILPALFLVTLCIIPFALAWLSPRDLKDFAQSLLGVVTFSSNILFWAESGYFGGAAELKPLLHTWSLAVEEQYYILFPPLLYALWRFGVPRVVAVLAVLLILSFALACRMIMTAPEAAFYLLPARCWQLLAGALVAFFLFYRPAPVAGPLAQAAGIAGVGLIAWAVFVFDHHTPFPGPHALVPVLGCVLLILFAVPGTMVQRLLSQRAMVGIGLISYSVYLWHQPLLAFAKYRSTDVPDPVLMLGLCAASLPLAWLTWRFVETPFRDRRLISWQKLTAACSVTALVLAGTGLAGHKTGGFRDLLLDYRATGEDAALQRAILDATQDDGSGIRDDGNCRFRDREVTAGFIRRAEACAAIHGPGLVVLGDSHAINIFGGLARAAQVPFMISVSRGGCRPYDTAGTCHYEGFAAWAAQQQGIIGTVLYHQAGSHFVADADGVVDSMSAFRDAQWTLEKDRVADVAAWLSQLAAQSGTDVIWLGPFPEYRYRPRDALLSREFRLLHPVSVRIFADLEILLQEVVTGYSGFSYVPFESLYRIPQPVFDGSCFHFRDLDHFSDCGEAAFGTSPGVSAFVERIAGGQGS